MFWENDYEQKLRIDPQILQNHVEVSSHHAWVILQNSTCNISISKSSRQNYYEYCVTLNRWNEIVIRNVLENKISNKVKDRRNNRFGCCFISFQFFFSTDLHAIFSLSFFDAQIIKAAPKCVCTEAIDWTLFLYIPVNLIHLFACVAWHSAVNQWALYLESRIRVWPSHIC